MWYSVFCSVYRPFLPISLCLFLFTRHRLVETSTNPWGSSHILRRFRFMLTLEGLIPHNRDMNKAEINEIANKLTQPQKDILLMLDGRLSPLELNGTYSRTCKSLADKGLVRVQRRNYSIRYGPISGGPYNTARLMVTPILTQKGADFIYNGGLDR